MTLLLGILLGEVYIFPKSEQNFTVSTGEHMYIESDNLARVNKVTQRTKRKLYAEQDILQTHVFCSCLNINQSAGNISKGNRNTAKRKENGLSYSLFKTRRVSRKMQHDRLQASTLTYLLRSRCGVRCGGGGSGGCTRGGGRAS